MSKLPSVTVVIPTRDRPLLLARAIESIVAQDYEGRVECLIVADRSEAALPDLRLAANRAVHAVANVRAPGLAGARNTGCLAADGDLIAFCDDDDEWLPEKLRRQVDALRALGAPALMSCGIEVRRGSRARLLVPEQETLALRDVLRARHPEFHASTFLVPRRHLLDGIGLLDEELPGSYAEDYDFLIRAARVGLVASVFEPLVRVHAALGSSWFAGRWPTIVAALQYLLDKHPEFASEPRGRARLYARLAFGYAALGQRRKSRAWARRSIVNDPRQVRGYVALLASAGVAPAAAIERAGAWLGKGM